MKKIVLSLVSAVLLLPTMAFGQNVIVTRNFTGLWDQPAHESQGINLQVIDQASGQKVAVAYWFTYGDDMKSAWFLGVGVVEDNRIEMLLFEGAGVGFLEDNAPGNDRVAEVGTMEMEFSSCSEGVVRFETDIAAMGSGSFEIERFSDLFNTRCSGGISDDTPSDVIATEQRIPLSPARDGVIGSGHADFEERADRVEFSVEAEDIPDGDYRIFVDGVDRGGLKVALGRGETEFRSPSEAGKVLLTFDPRGAVVEIHDNRGAILTSGDSVIGSGGGNGGGGAGGGGGGGTDDGGNGSGGSGQDFGSAEIDVDLVNTGVYPAASGDARLRPREDRTDFRVEIEDVPEGSYGLRIGGAMVGTIQAVLRADGTVEGELEFRDPVEPGKQLLDFDPRGEHIEVLDGAAVILETLFPSG